MNVLQFKKCLDLPERLSDIVGAAWVEHIPFAFWLMEAMRPASIVELGVWAGDSYLAWCQAAKALALPIQIRGIDHWQGDFQTGDYGEELFQSLKTYHDERYASFSTLIRSSFTQALPAIADASVDLLHIDGLHTYEAVREDFETWLPKVSPRGIILFHDTTVTERQFGVWKLWEELTARYPHFSFNHGFGLGVLLVGPDVSAPVRELAALGGPEADEVRAVFAELGRHIRALESLQIAQVAARDTQKQMERKIEEQIAQFAMRTVDVQRAVREQVSADMRQMNEAREAELVKTYDAQLEQARQELRRQSDAGEKSRENLADLEKNIEKLKAQLEKTRDSRSFKLGRALTSPARIVRDILKPEKAEQ